MEKRGRKANRDGLREHPESYPGVIGALGAFSEFPGSYLECPGGLCAGQKRRARAVDE